MTNREKLLIDTDGGVDDALAILAALGADGVEVTALTTVAGNVNVDQATRNAALIRHMFDPRSRVPISPGAPAAGRPKRRATDIHGADGLGGIGVLKNADGSPRYVWPKTPPSPLSATKRILDECAKRGRDLTLAFLGPLTNLAAVIRSHGVEALNGARIVFMGGSFKAGHNRPRRADFNTAADVAAAKTVFASGLAVDLVSLELCERYILTRRFLARMMREHPSAKARFVWDIHQRYMDYYASKVIKSVDGCYPHDTIAVTCAVRPELFSFAPRAVDVVARVNDTYGHTVVRPGGAPNARVATDFDTAAFEDCLVKWVWAQAEPSG